MADRGTMTIDGDIATIEFTRRFSAGPERVWRALTDGEELGTWLSEGSTFAGGAGGVLSHDFGEGGLVTGTVKEWDPPSMLTYTWVFPDGVESVLSFELSPDGDGTVLHLIHTRVPTQTAMGYTPGWHAFLDRLAANVAGEEIPTWDERFEVVGPLYQG
jgi:uncharacterized protein YndB with AHSA1/START domain